MSYVFSPNARPIAFLSPEPIPEQRVGEFVVAPVVKPLENGWFASSVSIRTHCGSSDRVLSLTRLFKCAKEAGAYARAEALQWIRASGRPVLAG